MTDSDEMGTCSADLSRGKLERLPPAYQLAPIVPLISIVAQIYNIHLTCITEDTFFLSQPIICARDEALLSPRERGQSAEYHI